MEIPYVFLIRDGKKLIEKDAEGHVRGKWESLKKFPREWAYAKTFPLKPPDFVGEQTWYWSVLHKRKLTVKYGTHSLERCWVYGDVNIGERVYISISTRIDYGLNIHWRYFRRGRIHNISDNVIFVEAM